MIYKNIKFSTVQLNKSFNIIVEKVLLLCLEFSSKKIRIMKSLTNKWFIRIIEINQIMRLNK